HQVGDRLQVQLRQRTTRQGGQVKHADDNATMVRPTFQHELLCNAKIAKYLVSKGANANHQNKQGQTAAHFCIAYQFFDLSTWLFENGADDTVENKFGLTPYDGLSAAEGGDEDTVLAIDN
ncbi:ankyrin repeat domain-containing protein, partial [archaeon]